MRAFAVAVLALVAVVSAQGAAHAHALQPGYLELQILGDDTWRAFWRKPDVKGRPMAIDVSLPATCDAPTPPESRFDGAAWIAQWVATCPGGLRGGTISVPGLETTQTDVLIRYELTAGEGEARRLTPDEPAFIVPEYPSLLDVLSSYFNLGVEHILDGIDHLLFVFALLLLIRDHWKLVGAVTAFTVAHSVTLAAATLGWVSAPGPPVEAVIALSIMFLASELLKREGDGTRLSERYPWAVSFAFGLLHGFGFAGALAEIGIPKGDVPAALLAFNLGVEAGQLLFIAAVLIAWAILSRIMPAAILINRAGNPAMTLAAYAIGGVSAFWFIERVAGF